MKIIKFKKGKANTYKVVTNKGEYELYDDIIIKHEVLLKKEIDDKAFEKVLKENNLLKAYYECLKMIGIRLRTEKELNNILKKKNFKHDEISFAIERLEKEGYLNHQMYIEAYIHDRINLYLEGTGKIIKDLKNLGFLDNEILPYINNIDQNIFLEKIKKYITKKSKNNKKSVYEFKRKTMNELINKGFKKEDILDCLNNLELEENLVEIEKIVFKLYNKYIKKYDEDMSICKIRNYLYQKGYQNVNIENIIKKAS